MKWVFIITVWVALGGLAWWGRYEVVSGAGGNLGGAYVLDRWTGEVTWQLGNFKPAVEEPFDPDAFLKTE